MFIIMFMGYKECNNKQSTFNVGFPLGNSSLNKDETWGELNLENDNIFIRKTQGKLISSLDLKLIIF